MPRKVLPRMHLLRKHLLMQSCGLQGANGSLPVSSTANGAASTMSNGAPDQVRSHILPHDLRQSNVTKATSCCMVPSNRSTCKHLSSTACLRTGGVVLICTGPFAPYAQEQLQQHLSRKDFCLQLSSNSINLDAHGMITAC